jgi:hypothetical protein
MQSYSQLPHLSNVLLEESYVLDIEIHPGFIKFKMEFVLTSDHPEYTEPPPTERYCYRRGLLSFDGVIRCLWSDQGAPPATDATGETDYGNIDAFRVDGSFYSLEGDRGSMDVVASGVEIRLE